MQVIGIQIDKPFVRIALLQKNRNRIEISTLKSALLADSNHVKQLYFPHFKGSITSGLSPKEVLIRSLELKITDTRYINKALEFHSGATTHFNPDEIISVPHLFKKNKKEFEALLFTASKEALKSHLLEMKKIGIDPTQVTAHSMALIRYIQWKEPSLQNAFLIHLGSSEWSCILMEEGKLKKAYSLTNGTEALLTALWEDRKKLLLSKEVEGVAKQIDLLQLKPHLNPHLSLKINEMRHELTKIISSFHRISNQQPLIFTGNTDGFGHLTQFLIENFKDAVIAQHPISFSSEEQKHAISIGLGLEHTHHSLQFLKQEFFPKKNWRRTGLYSLTLFISSIILALLLLAAGTRAIQARKTNMITTLEKTLDIWDPELKKSIFLEGLDPEILLNRWISTVEKHNKDYPYILQAPKMHEVLLWLTQHPFLNQIKEQGEPIVIQRIHYQLVQYPTIEAPKESYQAKVELEFKTPSPMSARKFHEFLLNGDALVDPDPGIEWEMLNQSYRASFFLKNRSAYVP